MKRFKKKLIYKLIWWTLLLTIVLFFLHALVLDSAPSPDQDLQYIPPSVPEAENGWSLLQEATASLEGHDEELDDLYDIAFTGRAWDHPEVYQTVEDLMPAIEMLSEIMAYPQLQCPKPKLTQDGIILPKTYTKSRSLARLAVAHGHHQIARGELVDGLEVFFTVAELGHRLEGAGGGLYGGLIGQGVTAIALIELHRVLDATTIDRELAVQLIQDLDDLRQDPDAIVRTVKQEYEAVCFQIDWFADGSRATPTSFSFSDYGIRLVKPNRTKAKFADAYRFYLTTVGKRHSEIKDKTPPPVRRASGLFLGGNFGGDILYNLLLPNDYWVVKRANRADALLNVTQTMIALKVYQQDHGRLPGSLSGLVPHYLQAVPIDPFDGGPLGYSRDKGILYVVGPDLADDGGANLDEALEPPQGIWNLSDPSWAIRF